MKVLILDNYDSFTFNLYQYAGEILEERGGPFVLDVLRNDSISVESIQARSYHRIILSPGPGTPADPAYFGVCADVIDKLAPKLPILGICLGMQGIAHVFGAKIERAQVPMHGKTTMIQTDGKGLFHGLPSPIEVMRYHSLVVQTASLHPSLYVSAWTCQEAKNGEAEKEREIMGLRHCQYPLEGIQFHPESFATEGGKQMIANFLHQK